HSFKVTTDAFALGDNRLVNHKTYYFVAIAYAYNNFKDYDQNDPTKLDGQKTQYVSSRLSYDGTAIRSVAAVPHNPRPELGGTYQIASYGSMPRVTRLDGHGNGNLNLELSAESRNAIIANGTLDKVKYDFNAGPVNVKVVDPLNVAGGYFEIIFKDYVASSANSADTASWVINRYDREGGNLIESITSQQTIAIDNEQLIPNWGVSVQITQHKYYNPNVGNVTTYFTEPISSSISFADSSKRWLSFINDDDIYQPTNWIRSGTLAPGTDDPTVEPWLNPSNYGDMSLGGAFVDPDQVYEKVLDGGIAPHKTVGFNVEFMPLAYSPAVASTTVNLNKGNASISYLPSVDIVITS